MGTEQVGIGKQMTNEKVHDEVGEKSCGKSTQINARFFFSFDKDKRFPWSMLFSTISIYWRSNIR